MNEGAFGAVSRDDIDSVIATLQGRVAIIEAKMAFRPFGSMTTEAGGYEDRFYVAIKLDLCLRRRGQLCRVEGGGGLCVGRNGEQEQSNHHCGS